MVIMIIVEGVLFKLFPLQASWTPCMAILALIVLLLLFHRDVKPIEHQLRPKGLGLEADRSALKDLEPNKRQRPPKPGEERVQEEELVMGPGGCVLVQSGAHKDLYGKVEFHRIHCTVILHWKTVPHCICMLFFFVLPEYIGTT